ncbi:MAG: oligopeptide:H+ symporter [Pseudomonadota bacterium]
MRPKHSSVFNAIFLLEIWERFGYYSVQAILAYFLVNHIGLNQAQSFILFGAYNALVYCFVAAGGYIGDKVLGAKRTMLMGLAVLLLGYLLLGFAGKAFIYFSLSLVCVGTGLFKSNPSSLLSKCYISEGPEHLQNAFTWYYMAINIGGVLGLFGSPIIAHHLGYSYSFITSAIGMCLAFSTFFYHRKTLATISTQAGSQQLSIVKLITTIMLAILAVIITSYLLMHIILAKIVLVVIALIVIIAFCIYGFYQTLSTQYRMTAAIILMVEAIIFQVLYLQMPTSINFFTIHNVTHQVLGLPIQAQSFQALDPIWIMIISPFLASFYVKLKKSGYNFNIARKFALGMFCCSAAFLTLFTSRYFANSQGIVSSWWIILSYFFQATGELLISALGVAMVSELIPEEISGFAMGMWFVFLSIGNFLSGYVAALASIPKHLVSDKASSLIVYTSLFLKIGLIVLLISLVMFLTSNFKTKLIGKIH